MGLAATDFEYWTKLAEGLFCRLLQRYRLFAELCLCAGRCGCFLDIFSQGDFVTAFSGVSQGTCKKENAYGKCSNRSEDDG
jgi:hypothetical protein